MDFGFSLCRFHSVFVSRQLLSFLLRFLSAFFSHGLLCFVTWVFHCVFVSRRLLCFATLVYHYVCFTRVAMFGHFDFRWRERARRQAARETRAKRLPDGPSDPDHSANDKKKKIRTAATLNVIF